jgi:transposase-like protein
MTATRRRYTRKQKSDAVQAAIASSTLAAAEQSGIPESTLRYWVDSPEFAELREKTQEERAAGWRVVGTLAVARLVQLVPEMEPRDLITLAGVATDKSQILSGGPTERTETRDLTFDDHEADILGEVVRSELERRADQRVAQDAVVDPSPAGAEGPAG